MYRRMQTPKRRETAAAQEQRRVSIQPEDCEALDKSTIADLSATIIDKMTYDELIRVIRAAGLLAVRRDDFQGCLPLYDCGTLRRLAHLARRYCQNQASRSTSNGSL